MMRVDVRVADWDTLSERVRGLLTPYRVADPFPAVEGALTFWMTAPQWQEILAVMSENGPVNPITRDQLREMWRAR